LNWLGHVRMDGERTVKKLQEGQSGGGGKKGRTSLRWMDDVKLDLRNTGVKRWRTRAVGRIKWASVVRKAKAKLKWL